MKSLLAAAAVVGLAAMVGLPAPAAAHDGWHHHGPRVGVFFGFGGPFYDYPRPYYYPGRYYYDPPVVVYRPAPPPRVVYVTPPPTPVTVSPASPVYTDSRGRTCREYQTTVTVGGAPQPAYGTACLQPDGSWQVVR